MTENDGEAPESKKEEDLAWVSSFEDLLEVVGTKGPWNVLMFLVCASVAFNGPMNLVSYQFLGATPDYWCHVAPLVEANWTQAQILDLAIPYKNASGKYDGCQMYDYNYTAAVQLGYEASISNVAAIGNGTLVECSSRDFNLTQYKSTIVTEWDLVCDRRAIYSTTQAVVQGGMLLGSLFFGYLIDVLGRRPVVLFCVVLWNIASFLTAASPNVELYIFLKVLITFLGSGQYIALFVFSLETCAVRYRSAVGALFVIPWALGYMVVPGIAYLVRTWKWLQVAFSIPGLFALIYFWLLPESPRWLLVHGRYQETLKVLSWAAKTNGKAMPPDHVVLAALERVGQKELPKEVDSANAERGFKSVVSSALKRIVILYVVPEFRVRTLVTIFGWFAANIVYYGIALNATNLSTDPYLYIFLGGLLEIPAYLLLWPALVFIGRKKSLVGLFLVCGVSILLVMTLMLLYPSGAEGAVVFLAQFGKMAVTAAFELVWMYTTELFPTQYRSLAMGEANFLGKMGATCSPYINDILGQHVVWAPSALFGLVSVLAAALTLLLPETGQSNMPESSDFVKKDDSETDMAMKEANQGMANESFVSEISRTKEPQTTTDK